MSCCHDPTEPPKTDDHRLLLQEQQLYGNLLRDLFVEDPEKLMLKQLRQANTYIHELAALNAHYASVRSQAIQLLDAKSIGVLERIVAKDAGSEIASEAQRRLNVLRGM